GTTCSPGAPSDLNQPCENCGGHVQCDGECSVHNPPGYGQPCGCNNAGTTQCDLGCSVPDCACMSNCLGSRSKSCDGGTGKSCTEVQPGCWQWVNNGAFSACDPGWCTCQNSVSPSMQQDCMQDPSTLCWHYGPSHPIFFGLCPQSPCTSVH